MVYGVNSEVPPDRAGEVFLLEFVFSAGAFENRPGTGLSGKEIHSSG